MAHALKRCAVRVCLNLLAPVMAIQSIKGCQMKAIADLQLHDAYTEGVDRIMLHAAENSSSPSEHSYHDAPASTAAADLPGLCSTHAGKSYLCTPTLLRDTHTLLLA